MNDHVQQSSIMKENWVLVFSVSAICNWKDFFVFKLLRLLRNWSDFNVIDICTYCIVKTFQLAQVRHLTAATAAVWACMFLHAWSSLQGHLIQRSKNMYIDWGKLVVIKKIESNPKSDYDQIKRTDKKENKKKNWN